MRTKQISGLDPSVLSAWRQQVSHATRHPGLQQQLVYGQGELLPRFTEHYEQLTSLSRPVRRSLQRRWKQSLAGVALLLALGAQPALAATINVGGGCRLIDAITAANTDAPRGGCSRGKGADTIVLPRGSTRTLISVNNSEALFGPTGLPIIRSAITIMGNGSTIGRAPNAPRFRILGVADTGNLRLVHTTVSGGRTVNAGGAVYVVGGVLTLTNTTITGNTAGTGGGVSGGRYSTLTITNSIISGNLSDATSGGISSGFGSELTLINSTISGNSADSGGGGVRSDGAATITNSTISGNHGRTEGGGVDNRGTLTMTNSTISSNNTIDSDYGHGGGVFNGNIATITNCTISGNSAGEFGGGVFTRDDTTLTLARNLISGNTAPEGAEMSNGGLPFPSGGTVDAANFNVFGHDQLTNAQAFVRFTPGTTDITATADGNTPTALAAILDTTLATNRGATKTHALVTGSPAIDAVNDGTCPPPARDQRGMLRPQDGNGDGGVACDTGAFERLPPRQ